MSNSERPLQATTGHGQRKRMANTATPLGVASGQSLTIQMVRSRGVGSRRNSTTTVKDPARRFSLPGLENKRR
jgi:hypothetical protein